MKILIGYDGSPCAENALVDLRRAGLQPDVNATVTTAAEIYSPLSTWAGDRGDEYFLREAPAIVQHAEELARKAQEDARATAEQGAARIHRLFPTWDVHAETSNDSPATALLTKAKDWNADLIVVGSHGRSALERVALGSVSQQVLHHAPCSVRLARRADPTPDPEAPPRLLIGIDGSPEAAAAVSAVAARNWPRLTEVRTVAVVDTRVILNVIGMAATFAPGLDGGDDSVFAVLEHHLDAAADQLRRAGLTTGTRLLNGDPKRLLLQEAQRWKADCIFLGWRGHSRLERLLLGSVASALPGRAACSVEVVRAR